MQKLPTPEEQEWLIQALADLIAAGGAKPFTSMPIVEPTRKHFPDTWKANAAGLDRVSRRLMQYASLGSIDIEATMFVDVEWPGHEDSTGCRSLAGFFAGIDDGVCRFGYNAANPADEAYMSGIMAHEVSHAFRLVHDLRDLEAEEYLTDVTAAYLGFGILVANNSYRYRTYGDATSGFWQSTSKAGYLPPQALCFLLAVQFLSRSVDPEDVDRLLSYLEPNQRGFTRAAMKSLEDSADQIANRLGLPSRQVREPTPTIESILEPLPEFVEAPDLDTSQRKTAPVNEGRPVFRLSRSRAVTYAIYLGGLGTVAGLAAVAIWETLFPILVGVIGFALGAVWGHRRSYIACSDRDCGAKLDPAMSVCPECGGSIVGSIRRSQDRLAAEEAWEDAMRASRRKAAHARKHPN